eukprot:403351103
MITDCSIDNQALLSGNIIITNSQIIGPKYQVYPNHIFDLQTPFNITFDNVTFNTHNYKTDQAYTYFKLQNSGTCTTLIANQYKALNSSLSINNIVQSLMGVKVLPSTRKIIFTNVYVKDDYQYQSNSTQLVTIAFIFNNFIMRGYVPSSTTIDTFNYQAQILSIIIQNVTVQDIQITWAGIFAITTDVSTLSFSNIQFDNTTISDDQKQQFNVYQLAGGTIYMQNFSYINSLQNAVLPFFFYGQRQITFDQLQIENITFYDSTIFQALITTSGLAPTTVYQILNSKFKGNSIYYNQAIRNLARVKQFQIINTTFENELMGGNVGYFICSIDDSIYFKNLTFKAINYYETNQIRSFILKIGKLGQTASSKLNSTIENIIITNSSVNFLSFNGFQNEDKNSISNQKLTIKDIALINNTFEGETRIFQFDSYQTSNFEQVEMINLTLDSNNFLTIGMGYIMLINCNMQQPLIIQNSTFSNMQQASFLFQASNEDNINMPLQIFSVNNKFENLITYSNSIIIVRTNTQLYVKDSVVNKVFSTKRGGFVIADYYKSYVSLSNTTFERVIAFNGGVFFAHYESYVDIDSCSFKNCVAIQNGVGNIENEARVNITNSIFIKNSAIKNSLIGITEALSSTSIITNCTLNSNKPISLESFRDDYIPQSYLSSFNQKYSSYQLLASVGEIFSIKVMRANLHISNSTQQGLNVQIRNIKYDAQKYNNQKLHTFVRQCNIKHSKIRQNYNQEYDYEASNTHENSTNIQYLNQQGILAENSLIYMDNSNFNNLQSNKDGGAISLYNSNITMTQCNFNGNRAISGGALSMKCSQFGIRILSVDQTSDAASGQLFQSQIIVELFDVHNQRLNNDSLTTIQIVPVTAGSSISGETTRQVQNGIATFYGLYFSAAPGSRNIECLVCDQGSFSFELEATGCNDCLKNTQCFGSYKLSVDPGFWRSSFFSTQIHECVNSQACLGGFIEDASLNQNSLCAIGYGGNLCDTCIEQNGIKYVKVSPTQCGKCPEIASSMLYMIGFFLALVALIAVMIYLNQRTTKESELNVLLRIITNYFQIMTTAAAFDLEWPMPLKMFFQPFSFIGDTFEGFINLDCFLYSIGFYATDKENQKENHNYKTKAIFISLIPIFVLVVYVTTFLMINIIRKRDREYIKNHIILSSVVTLFTLHPTLTKFLFGLFNCLELDSGEYWLRNDLQIRCWSDTHLKLALGTGLPAILIWVVGLPVLMLVILKRNQKDLDQESMLKRYKMIYQGFQRKYFFWEYINTFRKVMLIVINVFLSIYINVFKVLLSLMVLVFLQQFQKRILPFKSEMINLIEQREYMATCSLFMGSLFFYLSQENSKAIQFPTKIARSFERSSSFRYLE